MLLVLGKSGQLARALAERDLPNCVFAGRETIDLLQPDLVEAAILALKPSAIINAAAYTNVDSAENDGKRAFSVNAHSVKAIVSACWKLGVPLIHVSTDYVFSGDGAAPYCENDPIAPINLYGASKAEGEAYIEASNLPYAIIRTSWVYGEFGTNFVRKMLELARAGASPKVVDDQIGRPTYVADLADVCLFMMDALQRDSRLRGIYHFANKGAVSWADVADEIFRIYAEVTGTQVAMTRVTSDLYPTPAKRPKWSVLDTSKFENFGLKIEDWKPRLEVCVRNLLDRDEEA